LPAALLGLPLVDLLSRARQMAIASGPRAGAARTNAGLWLGAVLGEAARAGRDKLTLVATPGVAALSAWLEQLVAESTGKEGHGIVPVAGEPLGTPEHYGKDRLFVQLRLRDVREPDTDAALDALEKAGHPVVRLVLDDPLDVAGEFVRWEVATAIAAHVLGVNAFDEPNVSQSKANTSRALTRFESGQPLSSATALVREGAIALFSGGVHGSALRPAAAVSDDGHEHGDGHGAGPLERVLAAHFAAAGDGDYVAILAFLDPTAAEEKELDRLRALVFEHVGTATTLGLGPRYLHSTGQLHKGGPNRGVFLVLTFETRIDRPVPGERWSFGVLLDAQAAGDVEALIEANRRVLRVHLEGPRDRALAAFRAALESAFHAPLGAHAGTSHA
jgi:hypothetical protein